MTTICTSSLVQARVEAALREDPDFLEATELLLLSLDITYSRLRHRGFKPHEAEIALHHITQQVITDFGFADPYPGS